MSGEEIIQRGSKYFRFDLILEDQRYRQMLNYLEQNGMVENECDHAYDNLTEEGLTSLTPIEYVRVFQKTQTWLILRNRALGTASSVGKFIVCSAARYQDERTVSKNWIDKLWNDKFVADHTTRGHMKFGVVHEDVAMHHFAAYTNLKVNQIGTIKLMYTTIEQVGAQLCGDFEKFRSEWDGQVVGQPNDTGYLLVSPDAIVYQLDGERIGMLEIKCVSPFENKQTDDGYLKMRDDMYGSSLWRNFEQVPFYYVTQMALQALAGWSHYKMNSDNLMWLIRWCPQGFSLFSVRFYYLFKLGVWVARYYRWMKSRIARGEKRDTIMGLPLSQFLSDRVNQAYLEVKMNHKLELHDLDGWYPAFSCYRQVAKHFKFYIPEE